MYIYPLFIHSATRCKLWYDFYVSSWLYLPGAVSPVESRSIRLCCKGKSCNDSALTRVIVVQVASSHSAVTFLTEVTSEERRFIFVIDFTKVYLRLHSVEWRIEEDTEALVAK
jgi:hypothetical protein